MSSNEACLAHLRSGGWVLTGNQRQARLLRRLHDRARLTAGDAVWPTARVLPLAAWLGQQWREAAAERPELPELLPGPALHWLWRRAVEADAGGLVDPAALAASARASWLRLREYGGDSAGLTRWPLTTDQRAFAAWCAVVERALAERVAADEGDLIRLCVQQDALPAAGQSLLLAGFHRLTPALSTLITALRRRGFQVVIAGLEELTARVWQHTAADPQAEERALARWLRARIGQEPAGIHAVILPGLAARREAVERTLSGFLQPELELPGGAGHERIFDLSAGAPLLLQSLVGGALELLACLEDSIGWETASRLLRSPWFAGGTGEVAARVRADLGLRNDEGRLDWPVAALAEFAHRHGAPGFAAALQAAVSAAAGAARRPPGAWAECFGRVLADCGWPGEQELTSSEYQAAQAVRDALQSLMSLDRVAGTIELHQALRELDRLLAAPFQPERGEPSVFVLDALESPGLWFDSLWVAGLTAAAWPQPLAADPWLPIEIQRRLGMPGVTAEDRLGEARAVLAAWQQGCGELVLSWPRSENDSEVDASVLLPECPALPDPPAVPRREELLFAARRSELLADDPAPACGAGAVPGGARRLELQARCPFRAFAELRLAAAVHAEPRPGPDRLQRGTVLHRALELFWLQTGSQASLLVLDDVALEERILAVVRRATAEKLPAAIGVRARRLEEEWQRRAIRNLLAIERDRPDFTVIGVEQPLEGRLGGLDFRLRVDRVDRIGDTLVIIDYKSGRWSAGQWRGARLEAPQLPLYAVLHPGHPTGIAVTQVSAGTAGFIGVAGVPDLIDGVRRAADFELTEARERGFDWQQITQHWWAWLERLARDHAAGRAEVDPKQGAATCRGCHLGLLCRVAIEPAGDDEGEEAGDES